MKLKTKIEDYLIRHLCLNDIMVRNIDLKIPDTVTKPQGDAIERLKRIYEPPHFSCVSDNQILEKKYNLQIIIPMYNVQKYIGRCLDSIFSQKTKYTYKIIVVDDGSTDASAEIVKKKYRRDNLQLIRQANDGTASARNVGLSNIEADYVMFVDADDMLKKNAIENLLDTAYSQNACIVEGGYELFDNGLVKKIVHKPSDVEELCGRLWGFAWAKVFRAEIFSNICFPSEYWYEDTIISYIVYSNCRKAVTIENVVYRYRRNKKGFSHIRGNDVKLLDSFWVLYNVISEMKRRNITVTKNVYKSILYSIVTCSRRLMYMNDEIRKEVLAAFSKLIVSEYSEIDLDEYTLSVFEEVLKNNDYNKYKQVVFFIGE